MLFFQSTLAGAFMFILDYLLFPQTFLHFTEMHLNITRLFSTTTYSHIGNTSAFLLCFLLYASHIIVLLQLFLFLHYYICQ